MTMNGVMIVYFALFCRIR